MTNSCETQDSEMGDASEHTTLVVSKQTRNRIKVLAAIQERNMREVVEEACQQWLERNAGSY